MRIVSDRSLADLVNEGVRLAYLHDANPLRASMVSDPLFARRNTSDIPVEVRVVSAQGSEDELEREPVLLVPFNKYRSGTISFTQEFLEPGTFVGLVTVGNDSAYVARFPFSVGAPRFSIWHYLGLGIAAVGAIFGFLLFGIKRRERILAGNRA